MGKILYKLEIISNETEAEIVRYILSIYAQFGWQEEENNNEVVFFVHCERLDILKHIEQELLKSLSEIKCKFSDLEEKDWVLAWKEFFTPVKAGNNFIVLPPWLAKDNQDRIPIIIEPKSAFGTGHHATTALCLDVISDLFDKGKINKNGNFLDLGTGSGILAIALSKLGLSGYGLDIDPLAIDNALENKEINNVSSIKFNVGSVEIVKENKFDLIVANILSGPLIDMSKDIAKILNNKSILILSGLLTTQADMVENAYIECGLNKAQRYIDGEWCALEFTCP